MKLDMSVVANELGEACLASCIRTPQAERQVTHIEVLSPEHPPKPGILYLARAEKLPHRVPRGLMALVCIGTPADAFLAEYRYDYCLLDKGFSMIESLSMVQAIFTKYSLWNDRLQNILLSEGSLQELIDASRDIMPYGMLLYDEDFSIFAQYGQTESFPFGAAEPPRQPRTTSPRANDDAFGNACIGRFSEEQGEVFRRYEQSNERGGDAFATEGPSFWDHDDGTRSLSINIRLKENRMLRFTLCPTRQAGGKTVSPQDKDIAPLQTLASFVRFAAIPTVKPKANEHRSLKAILASILDGEHASRSELAGAAARSGWDSWDDNYLCLLLCPHALDGKTGYDARPLATLIHTLEQTIPRSCVLFRNEELIAVVDMSFGENPIDEADLVQTLGNVASEFRLDVGTSIPFVGLRHVRHFYVQARSAVVLGAEANSNPHKPRVYKFLDYLPEFISDCIAKTIEPSSLCPEGLMRLALYDKAHSSNLYETLKTYVIYNCSPTQCCEQLFIHRSTFQYRINKALELLDMDVNDPDTRYYLLISFKLFDAWRNTARGI